MNNKFLPYLRSRWTAFIFPVGSPIAVFTISYFVTNMGLYAIPAGIAVVALMSGLTTWGIYNNWYAVEAIINGAKVDD